MSRMKQFAFFLLPVYSIQSGGKSNKEDTSMTNRSFTAFLVEFSHVDWGNLESESSAIRQAFDEVLAMADLLSESQCRLYKRIKEYQQKRLELIYKKLQEQDLDWCSYGEHIVPKKRSTKLLFVRRMEGSVDLISGADYEEVSRIFRVCTVCRKKIKKNTGPQMMIKQFSPIKKTRSGFLIYDGSIWQEKNMEGVKINIALKPDDYYTERVAKFLGIVPQIKCYHEDKLLSYPHIVKTNL